MGMIRFEEYELDERNYRLRRSGMDVKLERIPIELLLLLARRPGELIRRDEIIEKLWGSNINVDTENAINTAVRKVRLALADDPARPRFIQTVTGQGYRFLSPISDEKSPGIEAREESDSAGPPKGQPKSRYEIGSQITGQAASSHRRSIWAAAIVSLAALCAVFVVIVLARSRPTSHVSNYTQITNDRQAKVGPLLTDGLRLYFNEGTANHLVVAQVAASGGETAPLPSSLDSPHLMDISRSRSELIVGSYGPHQDFRDSSATDKPGSQTALWALSLPSGEPSRLGDVQADDASLSPDGQDLAIAWGSELDLARSDGTGRRMIASFPGEVTWPTSSLRWSPDGKRLRLTVFDPKSLQSSIWEVQRDGTSLHQLLSGWNPSPSECCGEWTPDGKMFVFQSTRGGKTEVWAIPERTWIFGARQSQPVQLTSAELASLAPAISPDGRKLYVIGQQLRGELARYDSRLTQFVPFFSGISAESVDFSRDGKWIAYVSFPDHILWRCRRDQTDCLQLTRPPMRPNVPRWSPDSRRLAFFDVAPGKPWKIYLIAADGGSPEPLLNENWNEIDPNWSPDGNSIVFSYFPVFDRANGQGLGVYSVDLKTGALKELPGSEGLWAPRWSPDGSHIVARSADSFALLLFDFKDQKWTVLARGEQFGFTNWSSDGQYVYYLRRGNEPAIMRVAILNGNVEQMADMIGVRQTGFRNAIWTGLTPDDSPLVLRDVGLQEIYSLDLSY